MIKLKIIVYGILLILIVLSVYAATPIQSIVLFPNNSGVIKEMGIVGNKIREWFIVVNGDIERIIDSDKILMNHKDVLSIGDAMIVKEEVSKFLEDYDHNRNGRYSES